MLVVNFQLEPPTHRANTFPHAQANFNHLDFVKYISSYSNEKNAKKLDKTMRIEYDGFKFCEN
jgi:hypothetical protein